jgi:hypothetical protein
MLKRIVVLSMTILLMSLLLSGCGVGDSGIKKIKDMEFTVLKEDAFPPELKSVVDEKKEQAFKLTFQDNGFLYICIGYGQQETGGYSISVNELYEADNAIYVDTVLLGPEPGSIDRSMKNSPSYPMIVLKTEYMNKSVVFN